MTPTARPREPLPCAELVRRVEAHLAALRCQLKLARSGIPDTYDVVTNDDGQLVLTNIVLSDFARLNGL